MGSTVPELSMSRGHISEVKSDSFAAIGSCIEGAPDLNYKREVA